MFIINISDKLINIKNKMKIVCVSQFVKKNVFSIKKKNEPPLNYIIFILVWNKSVLLLFFKHTWSA